MTKRIMARKRATCRPLDTFEIDKVSGGLLRDFPTLGINED